MSVNLGFYFEMNQGFAERNKKKKNHRQGDSFLISKIVLKNQAYIMIELPDIFCLPHPS